MPEDEDQQQTKDPGELALVDELGIEEQLSDPIYGGRGRLFSTAGRESPVAEFTETFLILHPPQNPFTETNFEDELTPSTSPRGVLLDNFGKEKKLPGAKYNNNPLYCLSKRDEQTGKHLVAWVDQNGKMGLLELDGRYITHDVAIKLRNRTHDGELGIFPEIKPIS
jgi:hypothetical protein